MDSKRDNTGIPPVPQGVKRSSNDVSQTMFGRKGRIVIPGARRVKAQKQPPLWQGLLLVALGALVCSYFTFIGAARISYGAVVTCYQKTVKEALYTSGVVLLVAGGASYLLGEPEVLISSIGAAGIAMSIGVLVARGALTVGKQILIVGVGTLVLLGGYELLAVAEGSSVSARVQEAFEFYRTQYVGSSVNSAEGFAYLRVLMQLLWPTGFTMVSILYYLIARIGARVAYRSLGGEKKHLSRFVEMDVPLWFVALGIVALAAYAASPEVPLHKDIVLMSALNVLVFVRLVLAVQGMAVGVWFMQRRKASPITTMFLFIFAAFLEIQVGMLAFVGLIDIWANFRHISRGRMPDNKKTTDTEHQSAQTD